MIRTWRSILLLVLLVVVFHPCGLQSVWSVPPATMDVIERLIKQLGQDDAKKRQEAAKELVAFGASAIPPLRAVIKESANPVARQQAAAALAQIERDLHLVIGDGSTGYWINRVVFAPDGKSVVATGGGVILFDLKTGKEVRRYLEKNFARCGLALSRDGKRFVTGHQHDRVVRLGEVETGKEIQTFSGHTAGVWAVALSADGRRVARAARTRPFASGMPRRERNSASSRVSDMVRSVDFSPTASAWSRVITARAAPISFASGTSMLERNCDRSKGTART